MSVRVTNEQREPDNGVTAANQKACHKVSPMTLNHGQLPERGSLKADAALDAKVQGLPKLKRCNWQAVTRIRKRRVSLKRRKIPVLSVAFAGRRGADRKASATSWCGIKARWQGSMQPHSQNENVTVTSPKMQSQTKRKNYHETSKISV